MERNAHYLIVGSFVALVCIAATIMLVWMAGSYDTSAYKRYTVYFEGSVSGLSEGSKVSYRGVHVGKVLTIRFDPDQPERIKTIIEVEESTPISSSSSVSLQAVGITGLSALAIKTKDAQGQPLATPEGEKYPVIHSEPSSLDQLFKDAPQITNSAIEVLARINKLLSDENLESLSATLNNVELASASIGSILNEENAEKIASLLKNLNSATNRVDGILRKNQKQMERFTGENLDEMSLLVKDTREMVNAYKILAEKLADDPSKILYKPNYEGVKVEQ